MKVTPDSTYVGKDQDNSISVMMFEPLGDGGIAHYTFNLIQHLKRNGIRAILFTNSEYELHDKMNSKDSIAVIFRYVNKIIKYFPWLSSELSFPSTMRRVLKLFEYPYNVFEAISYSKRLKVDCIHIQTVNYIDILVVLMAKLIVLPVVVTVHNILPWHGALKIHHKIILKLLYKLSDHIIIHTQEGKDRLMKLFNVEPGKISVIPHGDYNFFLPKENVTKEQARNILGIHENRKIILFFGAIRPNKGLDKLLSVLPVISRRVDDILLMIVGEPVEDYSRYSRIIKDLCLENYIYEKLGYIPNDDIYLYFTAADIVVLPYTEVTQSGVLHIAYAFGKPVVATDVGGFSEVIVEGKSGYLVGINDDRSFTARITDLFVDDIKRKDMGEYAKYLSDTKYSWGSIALETERIYHTLRHPFGK